MFGDNELSDVSSYDSDDSIDFRDRSLTKSSWSRQANISNDIKMEKSEEPAIMKTVSSKYVDENAANGTGPLKFESQ